MDISPPKLMEEFLRLEFKAIITGIENSILPKHFIGQVIDKNLLAKLPPNIDICGENGEYHSFMFDGSIFSKTIDFQIKHQFYRDYTDSATNENNRYYYLELK